MGRTRWQRESRFDSENDFGELVDAWFDSTSAPPHERVSVIGNLVMILGKSGSGKSASLRNFGQGEVGVFSVAGKRLPFRSKIQVVSYGVSYGMIMKTLKANKSRAYVIDDAGYLLQFANFARAKETGFAKFTDIALEFERLLSTAIKTNDDTNVYFLMHPDTDDMGREKPKTIGKMLDERLCVEGLFPIVIDCKVQTGEDGRPCHVFVTENDGMNLAKAPMGMFEPVMDNDLKAVDSTIRDYYEMAPIVDASEDAESEE